MFLPADALPLCSHSIGPLVEFEPFSCVVRPFVLFIYISLIMEAKYFSVLICPRVSLVKRLMPVASFNWVVGIWLISARVVYVV